MWHDYNDTKYIQVYYTKCRTWDMANPMSNRAKPAFHLLYWCDPRKWYATMHKTCGMSMLTKHKWRKTWSCHTCSTMDYGPCTLDLDRFGPKCHHIQVFKCRLVPEHRHFLWHRASCHTNLSSTFGWVLTGCETLWEPNLTTMPAARSCRGRFSLPVGKKDVLNLVRSSMDRTYYQRPANVSA